MRFGLIIMIFVPIILIFICALIILVVPVPFLPPPMSQSRNLIAAVIAGVLGLGYLIGLVVYLVSGICQAGQALDPVLISTGFTAQGMMGMGRQYTGTVAGRAAEVRYLSPQRGRSAVLDIYLNAQPGQRLAVVHQGPLLDCQACPVISFTEPELVGIQVRAEDEARARALLADPDLRILVSQMAIPTSSASGELYLQESRIWFRLHMSQITGEQVIQWLDDLAVLAAAAESI